ncbi:MAG: hypothetical protein ABIP51_23235 [Bacteroidia bacterium]
MKVQDKYRKWFSALGTDPNYLASTCVILGDSDIDYELAPNIDNSRILSSPFSVPAVKHKLIYNGVGKNLSGIIKCFARRVNSDGSIDSLYQYPLNENFIAGNVGPTLENGKNWESITFTDAKMGFILFFSTVLDFYLDENGIKKRLVETYDFSFDWDGSPLTPVKWNYIIDLDNGSIFFYKEDTTSTPIGITLRGKIKVVGQSTQKITELSFNF